MKWDMEPCRLIELIRSLDLKDLITYCLFIFKYFLLPIVKNVINKNENPEVLWKWNCNECSIGHGHWRFGDIVV